MPSQEHSQSKILQKHIPFEFDADFIWSKKRGIVYDLPLDFLDSLYVKQNKCCALSGLPISFDMTSPSAKKNITASLDRIDSTKPYVKDNVQWVHKTINKIKQDYPQKEFIQWCKKIANFQIKSV